MVHIGPAIMLDAEQEKNVLIEIKSFFFRQLFFCSPMCTLTLLDVQIDMNAVGNSIDFLIRFRIDVTVKGAYKTGKTSTLVTHQPSFISNVLSLCTNQHGKR